MEKYKNLNLSFPSKRMIAEGKLVGCLKLDEELNNKIINENNIVYGSKIRT